jgi:hypothetical protein
MTIKKDNINSALQLCPERLWSRTLSIVRGCFNLILLFLAIGFISCEDEVPLKQFHVTEGVFILNEGNYTYGNAALSFYNPETKELSNQIFKKTNGFPIGDVLQSMTIFDSTAFLVVNNSGKIHAISTNTFRHKGTISGLVSPRQMLVINSTKAYVSDLYDKAISIVNLHTYTKTGSIALKKSSEAMLKVGNYVFVTNWSKQNTIQRIDINTDNLVDSLVVTKQPNSLALDKNNKIWVLSDGGLNSTPGGKVKACLTRIDSETFKIEKEFVFSDLNSAPTSLCMNAGRDSLYFLNGSWGSSVSNGGIYRMSVNDPALPSSPWIPENGKLFYALGVDPSNGNVYVSDAIDYMQPGWVYRYSNQAVVLDSFKTDIIPSFFCFKYQKL